MAKRGQNQDGVYFDPSRDRGWARSVSVPVPTAGVTVKWPNPSFM
jgi:hypothetical protein